MDGAESAPVNNIVNPWFLLHRVVEVYQARAEVEQKRSELKKRRERLQSEMEQVNAELYPGKQNGCRRRQPPPQAWGIATAAAAAATIASTGAAVATCSACALSLSATAFCAAATGTLAAVQVSNMVLDGMEWSAAATCQAVQGCCSGVGCSMVDCTSGAAHYIQQGQHHIFQQLSIAQSKLVGALPRFHKEREPADHSECQRGRRVVSELHAGHDMGATDERQRCGRGVLLAVASSAARRR